MSIANKWMGSLALVGACMALVPVQAQDSFGGAARQQSTRQQPRNNRCRIGRCKAHPLRACPKWQCRQAA